MTITDKGAFYTGTYRNLFLELGYDDSEITEKLEKRGPNCFMEMPIRESITRWVRTKDMYSTPAIWMCARRACLTG